MKKLVIFAFLAFLMAFVSSCKKDKSLLQVRVYDSSGALVKNALVNVSIPEGTSQNQQLDDLERVSKTNENGIVCFDFTEKYKRGSAGLFQLNVKAQKDNLISDDYLSKIYENETTIVNVRLNN